MIAERMGDEGWSQTRLHLHLEATVAWAVLHVLALPERSGNKAFSRLPSSSTIPADNADHEAQVVRVVQHAWTACMAHETFHTTHPCLLSKRYLDMFQ